MSTLVQAVSGDTFNGLSGYKRPIEGDPRGVPSELPGFRGVPNKPGQPIDSPAIKSSANRPDRKTNICIPYARVTPVETPSDIGRLNEGDVAFCSKARPGLPGYAHQRMTRLAGVDALNRWMGPDNWSMKTEGDTYRYILKDPKRTGDDWRKVPFLGEWSLDGIVLSSDEKDSYYSKARDGNLYNIAIQGPTMVNNGFLDSTLAPNMLTPYNQGQLSRFKAPLDGFQMDYHLERAGASQHRMQQKFDFRADYRGEHYHLYPLQSFDREVRPMNELYCGLVATEYKMDDESVRKLGAINDAYELAETIKADTLSSFRINEATHRAKISKLQPLVVTLETKRALLAGAQAELNNALDDKAGMEARFPEEGKRDVFQVGQMERIDQLVSERTTKFDATSTEASNAQTAYDTAVKEAGPTPTLDASAIQANFAGADKMASKEKESKVVRSKTAYQKMGWLNENGNGKTTSAPSSFAAFRWVFFTSQQAWTLEDTLDQGLLPGEPRNAVKRQKTTDPYNNEELRKSDFRSMVGAYYLGKVVDCKAGRMPHTTGGPIDTGFRVTANVNIEWRDWRALRRQFNSVDSELQFGDQLTGCGPWGNNTSDNERNALFQWPTSFDPEAEDNSNVPVNMDFLYTADQSKLREMNYAERLNILRSGAASKEADKLKDYDELPLYDQIRKEIQKAREDRDGDAMIDFYEKEEKELDDFVTDVTKARFNTAPDIPAIPANPSAEHFAHRASIAAHRFHLLTAPVTYGEARAFLKGTPISSAAPPTLAAPAAAPTPAAPAAAPTPAAAPAATTAPATSAPASAGAGASSAPAAPPGVVLQAPSAPGKKRRAGGTDQFANIFGGSEDPGPQPLNPAHRSDGGAGSTGRSFQRRGKGPDK